MTCSLIAGRKDYVKRILTALTLLCALTSANAAPKTIQVTIGASATQVSSTPLFCRFVVFQNNAAHVIHIGDVNVSSTRGIQLASGSPGGSFTIPPTDQPSVGYNNLALYYIAGTQSDVIDVVCDTIN